MRIVTRNALTAPGAVRKFTSEAQEGRLLLINPPPFARHSLSSPSLTFIPSRESLWCAGKQHCAALIFCDNDHPRNNVSEFPAFWIATASRRTSGCMVVNEIGHIGRHERRQTTAIAHAVPAGGGPIMSDRRQDLLCVLQSAYALGQSVEQVLRRASNRRARRVGPVTSIDALLAQTLDQQRMLRECLKRIDDGEPTSKRSTAGSAAVARPAGQSENDLLHDLAEVRALTVQEIELYHSGIAAAESSGFFETRFVCEGILTQKSLMIEWLARQTPPHARS
jgi:ferritin-like metal-binding protein YciE